MPMKPLVQKDPGRHNELFLSSASTQQPLDSGSISAVLAGPHPCWKRQKASGDELLLGDTVERRGWIKITSMIFDCVVVALQL